MSIIIDLGIGKVQIKNPVPLNQDRKAANRSREIIKTTSQCTIRMLKKKLFNQYIDPSQRPQ
jgi:hypothetical protein